MTPTIDECSMQEVVGVEICPHKRWIGNATAPLLAFQVFNLPQDSSAYTERTREELVDRCLSRAGRVMLFTSLTFAFYFYSPL